MSMTVNVITWTTEEAMKSRVVYIRKVGEY